MFYSNLDFTLIWHTHCVGCEVLTKFRDNRHYIKLGLSITVAMVIAIARKHIKINFGHIMLTKFNISRTYFPRRFITGHCLALIYLGVRVSFNTTNRTQVSAKLD